MKYSWIDTELLQKPSVTKDLQAEWNWIRYHIGGKMFAAVCLDDATGKPVYITCKLDPAEGDFLRRQYEDIIPGYYMNKVHWNSVKAEGNVPDALLREMLEKILSSGAGQLQQKEAARAAGRGKEGCHLTTRKNIKSSISRRRNRKSSPFLR
mgnify:CR=1 FL=1